VGRAQCDDLDALSGGHSYPKTLAVVHWHRGTLGAQDLYWDLVCIPEAASVQEGDIEDQQLAGSEWDVEHIQLVDSSAQVDFQTRHF
jgi:hypothetical protein